MVGALRNEQSEENRPRHGRGTSNRSNRLSGADGELGFLKPGGFPAETVTTPGRFIIEPGGDHASFFDESRFGDLGSVMETMKKAKLLKLGRSFNLIGAGFFAGWELGQFLIDRGWIPMPGGIGEPDEAVGPDGWSNPGWAWQPCTLTCGSGSVVYRGSSSDGVCPENTVEGDCTTTGGVIGDNYPDPDAAVAAFPAATWVRVDRPHSTLANRWVTAGNFQKVGEGDWTQTLVPGVGIPIAPAMPMEDPMSWPQGVPMQMPTPQPWADAAPDSPLDQPTNRPGDTIGLSPDLTPIAPVLPLVPFPVVIVGPVPGPDGPMPPVVPPQVITVAPGEPPTGSVGDPPPLDPPPNPSRPGRNVRERKVHVRTVLPRTWAVINMLTEGYEIIDIMHDNLPDECKAESRINPGNAAPDPYSQLRAVWDCWDHLPADYWERVIMGLINNQIEDFVYGTLARPAQGLMQQSGQSTGLQHALRDAFNRASEGDPDVEGDEFVLPLPTIRHEDGSFVLTFE